MEIAMAGDSVNATLKEWVSTDASIEIIKWLHGKHNGRKGVNIVITDFVEENQFIETVLALNSYGQKLHQYFFVIFVALISALLPCF